MPWKEQRLETTREEFVKRVLAHEKSKSALCREYGISRPTGDKWISRYLSGEKMKDLSRAPKNRPNKTDPEIEKQFIELYKTKPFLHGKEKVLFIQSLFQKVFPKLSRHRRNSI